MTEVRLSIHEALRRIAVSRDADAWEALLAHSGAEILRTARRILGDGILAEDACQETLLQIRANAGKFIAPSTAQAANLAARVWIMRIAANVSLHMARARSRSSRRDALQSGTDSTENPFTPETQALKQEEAEVLRREISKLPAKLREPLVLKYFIELNESEVADALRCSPDAARMRVRRGLDRLRTRLAILGVALTLGDLTANLSGSATVHAAGADMAVTAAQKSAWSALLQSSAAPALGNALPAVGVSLLAKFFLSAAAIVMALAGTAFGYYAITAQSGAPSATSAQQTNPVVAVATVPQRAKPKQFPSITITPRGADAWTAFGDLERKGMRVFALRGHQPHMLVPLDLRYKPVDGWELVERVAAASDRKVVWLHDGTIALLQTGVPDAEIERVAKDLASADDAAREEAVWRSGWMNDARALPVLLKSAKDRNAEIVRLALNGLRHMKWECVVAFDETALGLVAAELEPMNPRTDYRRASGAAFALSRLTPEQALPLLENALAHPDSAVGNNAAGVLREITAENARPMLVKALTHKDEYVRESAELGLANLDRRAQPHSATLEKAFEIPDLALLEKSIADPDASVRVQTASALGNLGGAKACVLLDKMLADSDPNVRNAVVTALGNVGVEQALEPLARALSDPDVSVRRNTPHYLALACGEKALPALEQAITDEDVNVRSSIAHALGHIKSEAARALLEKMLSDTKSDVTRSVLSELHHAGGERALASLERALAHPNAEVRGEAMRMLGYIDGNRALALWEKTLKADPEHFAGAGATTMDFEELSAQKVQAMMERLCRDADPKVRERTVDIVGYAVDGDVALTLFGEAVNDPIDDVRLHATWALGMFALNNPARAEQVFALLERGLADPNSNVRSNAAAQLGHVVCEKARARLLKALTDKDSNIRSGATRGLSQLKDKGADKLIQAALADPNPNVKRDALSALANVDGKIALPLLENALKDKDSFIRNAAVATLGHLVWNRHVTGDEAVSILLQHVSDPDISVRCGVSTSLGNIGYAAARPEYDLFGMTRHPKPDLALVEKVSEALKQLLADKNANVRWMAAGVLARLGGEKPRDMLLAALKIERDKYGREVMVKALKENYGDVHVVQDALKALPALPGEKQRPAPADDKF